MSVTLITGSAGLVGSDAALFFGSKGFTVVGIDNNMRKVLYGQDGDTSWRVGQIRDSIEPMGRG
jgi:CDP-paratose 2-epimerase